MIPQDARGVVLITCDCGKEEKAKREALDCIFHLDPDALGVITQYPGVVLIASARLSSNDISDAIVSSENAYIKKVVPFQAFLKVKDLSEAVEAALKALGKFGGQVSSFKVSCRKRGAVLKSAHELEEVLGNEISKAFGLRADLRSPQLEVVIEVVDDLVGICLSLKQVRKIN